MAGENLETPDEGDFSETPTKEMDKEVNMISPDLLSLEGENSIAVVVDTGATSSVIGVGRAQSLQGYVKDLNFQNQGKCYKAASGNKLEVLSTATSVLPFLGECSFDVVDNPATPALLGQDFLSGSIVDLVKNSIVKNGNIIQLRSLQNGHRAIIVPKSDNHMESTEIDNIDQTENPVSSRMSGISRSTGNI